MAMTEKIKTNYIQDAVYNNLHFPDYKTTR